MPFQFRRRYIIPPLSRSASYHFTLGWPTDKPDGWTEQASVYFTTTYLTGYFALEKIQFYEGEQAQRVIGTFTNYTQEAESNLSRFAQIRDDWLLFIGGFSRRCRRGSERRAWALPVHLFSPLSCSAHITTSTPVFLCGYLGGWMAATHAYN